MATRSEPRRTIWVPGWGMSRETWGRLSGLLPGSHEFVAPAGDTPDALAADVAGRLEPGCVAIGWSLGGQLLIRAAAATPPAALVLIATPRRFVAADPALGWPERVLQRMRRRLAADPDAVLRDFTGSLWSDAERQTGHAESFPPPAGWSPEALAAGLDHLAGTDLTATSRQLVCPVLWVHGDADPICPFAAFERARRELEDLPNHRFLVVPGAGHALPWTHPDHLSTGIAEWLQTSTNGS